MDSGNTSNKDSGGAVASDPETHLMSNAAPSRKENHMFTATEETAVVRNIQSFHAPDGVEYAYDSKHVLNIVQDLLLRVNAVIPGVKHRIARDDRLDELHAENLMKGYTLSDLRDELLAYPVHKLSYELIWHCHSDGDGGKISEKIFQSLAPYAWEAKVVIALAAFTMQYGEFWLAAERYRTHPLAGSVHLLMQIPEIMGNMEIFAPKFKALTDLVDAMLDVTRSIIEKNQALIPTACYWVIKTIAACSSIFLNLMAMGHEYLTTQVNWELDSLGHKLAQTKGLLDERWRKLEDRRQLDIYLTAKKIFGTSHDDNLIGLKVLMNNKEDPYPLYDGKDAMKKPLDVLKRKIVLLLVSHLLDIEAIMFQLAKNLSYDAKMYSRKLDPQIEMVWIPVINHTDPLLKARYHEIQRMMESHSVSDPYTIEPGVVRFIRDEWKFEEKPILVVLDPHGRVSNYDAFHMYFIWLHKALPFDEARERELWRDTIWGMGQFVALIDNNIWYWAYEGRYICVFGGDDIDWIRRFVTMTRYVEKRVQISLKLVYVEKSTTKEFGTNSDTISREHLCYVMNDINTCWFFWERLKCLRDLREKHGLTTVNDEILQNINSVLIYDNSDRPWAVFGRGLDYEMAIQEGELAYKVLDEFPSWSDRVVQIGFVKAIDEVYKDHQNCTT